MERQILVKRWKLAGGYPDQVWRGKLGNVDVIMFGTEEMGRVSAAIATMRLLQAYPKPDMLLVAGIAGGFEREGVRLGDVLIPKNIADLATRKVSKKEDKIPEFRPKAFRTDARLLKYVRSDSFNIRGWEPAVIDEAEWPDGLRPTIHDGPVASLDEVVSDTDWVDALCKAWPKLSGVEMESGGVCAAAEVHDLRVAVVRGVSDLADPAKSDDDWRRRAMKTVAHLLETIDFAQLLGE
jgi:nucleoside phosphorylase